MGAGARPTVDRRKPSHFSSGSATIPASCCFPGDLSDGCGVHSRSGDPPMNPQLLPAQLRDDVPAWTADGRRLPRREGTPLGFPPDGRGLRPDALALPREGGFTRAGDPGPRPRLGARDRRLGAGAVVGDRRRPDRLPFELLPVPDPDERHTANPCDALERPKTVQSVARGLSADEVRRLLAVVPDTVAGRRDRALLLRSSSPADGEPRSSA